jgi:hypothetical protein
MKLGSLHLEKISKLFGERKNDLQLELEIAG